MKSKNIVLYILLGLVSFLGLVFFNYLKAQEAMKSRQESPLSVEITSYPKVIRAGEIGNFVWRVVSAPDLSTSHTAIYWGYESSPSALTKSDSPQAVGYPDFTPDYTSGLFLLPGTFDHNIRLDKPGKVFFRAYARVGGEHLWSAEGSLIVE